MTRRSRSAATATAAVIVVITAVGIGSAILVALITAFGQSGNCSGASAQVGVDPAAGGALVGATEYGGPGDPSSGTVGASGSNLLANPDTYAELGGYTFQTATAMGGLPYMTPLRISWANRSAIAYKRDFGFGGGPVAGLPRVIDLWWEFAGRLGIPYENGLWSGPVRISPPPGAGAGNLLGAAPSVSSSPAAAVDPASCAPGQPGGVPLTAGNTARLLSNGQAAAPAGAPGAVRQMIAAGNQIAGKPYLYGGGHGLPLDQIAPAYDCSSSVEHLLYGGGLLPVSYNAASGTLESFGDPGPGQWVTIYASPDHVFMYVAGLRWDTHNAAGAGDGSSGIGWHPLVRDASGFVARHPVGL